MAKKTLKPGAMLAPLPVVMVTSAGRDTLTDKAVQNVLTVAWTGIVNSDPPMTYVSVRKERYSHDLIEESGGFVINLVTEELAGACDFVGVRSGRDMDKFRACGLTTLAADKVAAPLIAESPVNLECRVMEKRGFPTHDMFIAEIVAVHVDDAFFDGKGRIAYEDMGLIVYDHGNYYGIKRKALGRFGFSVMKPETKKRLDREADEKRRSMKAAKKT